MTTKTAISLSPEREEELAQLVREFRTTFLPSAAAQRYLSALADARAVAVGNFPLLLAHVEAGDPVTDELLRKLLPHADTPANRWRGAWIHPVAAIAGDLRSWYEAAGWTETDQWPAIATALLGFVRQATANKAQLSDACTMWAALPYTTGFQSGLLTPILNALRPDAFQIFATQSRNFLNYFADTSYTQAISDYPAANQQLTALFARLSEHMHENDSRVAVNQQQANDRGLLFVHWLATEKRFIFRTARYWALAVGADPWVWQEWCEGNMIAIGGPGAWDELGDLTGLTRRDFYRRRDSLIAQHAKWTKRSAEPFWRFARQMQEGDSVAVYHDDRILGVGTLAGPYYFATDVPLGHRRPVEWRDLTPRRHGTAFATSTVMPIDNTLFTALATAPAIAEDEARALAIESNAFDTDKTLPAFVHYLAPLLETLQALGGQGRAGEVLEAVRDLLSDTEPAAAPSPTRTNRLRRHLYRARHYLLRAGLLTTEQHGIWQLTAAGRNTALLAGDAQQLYEEIDYQQQLNASLAGASETVRRLAETPVTYTTAPPPDRAALPTPPLVPTLAERYPLHAVAAATFLPETQLARWVQAIERKGQAIFYGPPGVGKTFLAEQLARHLAGGLDEENTERDEHGFVETVQFHAAYAYEDFVQGMRPQPGPDGQLTYPIIPGRFLRFCAEAARQQGRCTLIIDEINRADLARVFGELLYLLEYRDRSVRLAADGRRFAIPANVRIIGTMNSADRSIALVDHALRRRFAFIAQQPDWAVLRRFHEANQTGYPVERLVTVLQRVNRQIGDPQSAIGHSFFMTATLGATIADIWQLEIEPYLEEIFFDQPETVDRLRWERVRDEVKADPE
ncbi:MAG: AAA family ATPase [Caldilineaceae bacterium]|nr:AAA family ATPase [Caldilineaceae bacterium]